MISTKEPPLVLNLSDMESKRRLMTKIGTLQGLWEVTLKQRKRTRSLDQNAYYFAAFVAPWLDWLRREQGDPSITSEEAHEALKDAVLHPREVFNKSTGEVVRIPHRSRTMTTEEFSIYLDLAAKFLAEFCGIVVLPSDMF